MIHIEKVTSGKFMQVYTCTKGNSQTLADLIDLGMECQCNGTVIPMGGSRNRSPSSTISELCDIGHHLWLLFSAKLSQVTQD